jgi:hypothetical protein
MKRIALALAIISFTGCASIDQQARDACPRISPGRISTQCYNAQLAHLQAQQQADEDNAAILLMGGTAFVNGYNAGRDAPLPMVNYGAHVTMWSGASGMLQGY